MLIDPRLSWKAKGVLAYLMSVGDGRRVTFSALQELSTDGRAAVSAAIDELFESRYLVRNGADVEIAGNPQLLRKEVQKSSTIPKDSDAENRHSSTVGSAGNQQLPLRHADSELVIKNPKGSTTARARARTRTYAHASAPAREDDPADLFGEDSEKETLFRRSLLSKAEVYKQVFQREQEAGIDTTHYYTVFSEWSNKNNKVKRTAHGWRDTIRGAMRRDKKDGKLVMVPTQESDEAKLDFLKM